MQRLSSKFFGQFLFALFAYTCFSCAFFGWSLLPSLTTSYFGCTADPAQYIWFFAWCPYSVLHGLDIFHCPLIWAPNGYNMDWTTFAPGLAFLASPITLLVGPVIAYSLTCLFMPALSACACFVLLRHITRDFTSAFLGGYIYGFSTYAIVHSICHLAITPTFILPLALYIVLLRIEGAISARIFVVAATVLLTLQFYFSLEVLLTMTIFAMPSWLLALRACTSETRKKLVELALLGLVSYVFMIPCVMPYLHHLFAKGHFPTSFGPTILECVDLWNFIIPTPMTLIHGWCKPLVNNFPSNFLEIDGYVGVPLILIVVWFIKDNWKTSYGYILIFSLIFIAIAALGPALTIGGKIQGPMPWIAMIFLPLVKYAIPLRFMLYVFFVMAIMVAIWFAERSRNRQARPFKIALAASAILSLLPNVLATYYWKTELDTPEFFNSSIYKQYIGRNDIVLILPYGDQTDCLIWQVQTGMYFRMAGGYVNELMPPEYTKFKITQGFLSLDPIVNYEAELKAFLKDKGVSAIIVAPRLNAPWQKVLPSYTEYPPRNWSPMLACLGVKPLSVGGITLYKLK